MNTRGYGAGGAALVLLASLATLAGAGCATAGDAERQALARLIERDAAGFAEPPRPRQVPDRPPQTQPERNDQAIAADADLDDLVQMAMLTNPSLPAAFEQWRAAVQRIPQARSLPDPQLSYSYFVEQMMMRQMVGLRQTFPWWENLAIASEAAAAEARAAEQRFEGERLAVIYTVSDAWAEWVYVHRAMAVAERNVEILQDFVRTAEAAMEAGRRPLAEVTRAELEVEQALDELASLQRSRSAVAGRLNAALGRPADAPVPEPTEAAWPDAAVGLDESQLLAWASETNPELAALAAEVAGRRQGVRLARRNWVPDVTLGVGWQDGVMRQGNAVELMVGLNLPIWSGRLDAERAEALADYAAATHRRTDQVNELEASIRMAHYQFADAQRRAHLYETRLIPQAERSLEAAEAAYGEGQVDYEALTAAQTTLTAFQLTLERARRDRFQRLAELEMLIGRPLRDATIEQSTPPADDEQQASHKHSGDTGGLPTSAPQTQLPVGDRAATGGQGER